MSGDTLPVTALDGEFKRLNHKTYLFKPSDSLSTTTTTGTIGHGFPHASLHNSHLHPSLIYLATWMNAEPRHIAKYIRCYRALYPSTPILLVTSSVFDLFINSAARDYTPAIATVHSFVKGDTKSSGAEEKASGLLIHAFSNGGAAHIGFMSKLYFEVHGQPLPATAIIFDSSPGKARVRQGVATFAHILPKFWILRLPLKCFLGLLLVIFYLIPEAMGRQNLSTTFRKILNSVNPEYISKKAGRCYIYSYSDRFVQATDVEEHAREAEILGLSVTKTLFNSSPHVGHMSLDPTRYWTIVQQTWNKATGLDSPVLTCKIQRWNWLPDSLVRRRKSFLCAKSYNETSSIIANLPLTDFTLGPGDGKILSHSRRFVTGGLTPEITAPHEFSNCSKFANIDESMTLKCLL